MQRNLFRTMLAVGGRLLAAGLAGAESDAEGSKDPSLFTRMPGWYINQYEENEFASHEFTGTKGDPVTVEGHRITVSYTWGGSGKKPSSLQVVRNYENALKKIGGTVPYRKSDYFLTLKLVKNGKETWAEIASEVDARLGRLHADDRGEGRDGAGGDRERRLDERGHQGDGARGRLRHQFRCRQGRHQARGGCGHRRDRQAPQAGHEPEGVRGGAHRQRRGRGDQPQALAGARRSSREGFDRQVRNRCRTPELVRSGAVSR